MCGDFPRAEEYFGEDKELKFEYNSYDDEIVAIQFPEHENIKKVICQMKIEDFKKLVDWVNNMEKKIEEEYKEDE